MSRLTEQGAVAEYLAAWRAMYPGLTPPTVIKNGSWWRVKWADGGSKSARSNELLRMSGRLREMRQIADARDRREARS